MAWVALNDIVNHLGIAVRVLDSMVIQLGDFSNQIGNVSSIPEMVWRDAAKAAKVIITAAVPAQVGPPPVAAQPAVTRDHLPVETAQVGMLWRIASRIMWTRSGNTWANYPDFDVMVEPADRTAAFLPGIMVAPAASGWMGG